MIHFTLMSFFQDVKNLLMPWGGGGGFLSSHKELIIENNCQWLCFSMNVRAVIFFVSCLVSVYCTNSDGPTKPKYTKDKLAAAIRSVQDGRLTVFQAGRRYGQLHSSLFHLNQHWITQMYILVNEFIFLFCKTILYNAFYFLS